MQRLSMGLTGWWEKVEGGCWGGEELSGCRGQRGVLL